MFSLRRYILFSLNSHIPFSSRSANVAPIKKTKYVKQQIDYIESVIECNTNDWTTVKNNILNIKGSVNQKNVDGVLLKCMISNKKFDTALSFADYLKSSKSDLSLGSINGLLGLYYQIGKDNKLTDKEQSFILETYQSLYEKYKVLDSTTCERLLHALCVINEWQKALKVLDDILLSSIPTHTAYSTLIATLFKNNKKNEAMKLIQSSVNSGRPLQHVAYNAWIDYILKKYKYNETKLKYLNDIFWHISKNDEVITLETAKRIQHVYNSMDYKANFTKIRKQSGQCTHCLDTLECMKLSDNEFKLLQQSVKEKLIVGSDLFLKTSPEELKRFLNFIEKTAPYDIVVDGLNIAYMGRNIGVKKIIDPLIAVVDHLKTENKKILLLGRKHMLNWPKKYMEYLMNRTCFFFIENLSKDDPYFITAALLSGPHTDLFTKDLLRGHKHVLRDERLRQLFQQWLWQHQWMVFGSDRGAYNIRPPLKFTPRAQFKNDCWHLPYQNEESSNTGLVNDGIPDLSSWLCLRPT